MLGLFRIDPKGSFRSQGDDDVANPGLEERVGRVFNIGDCVDRHARQQGQLTLVRDEIGAVLDLFQLEVGLSGSGVEQHRDAVGFAELDSGVHALQGNLELQHDEPTCGDLLSGVLDILGSEETVCSLDNKD
ncbi:hypothetical protein CQ11_09030 [Trueperella pyogenes]|nr:hypothetical protein CQ11_09030 [Trueperella pyogenes]